MPRDIGTLEFTVSETQASYVVTVKISPSGKDKFKLFASYTVNGSAGTATLKESYPFEDPAKTSNKPTSSTDKTEPTSSSTTPTSKDEDPDE